MARKDEGDILARLMICMSDVLKTALAPLRLSFIKDVVSAAEGVFAHGLRMAEVTKTAPTAVALVTSTLTSSSSSMRTPHRREAGPKCWTCGKTGHKEAECEKRKARVDERAQRLTSVTCGNCGRSGHQTSKCWSRTMRTATKSSGSRRETKE